MLSDVWCTSLTQLLRRCNYPGAGRRPSQTHSIIIITIITPFTFVGAHNFNDARTLVALKFTAFFLKF